MIYRVTNYDGRVIDDFPPEVTDVLPVPVARLMVSMLREVINSGTSTRAKALKRPLAGKTGTTNEFSDAWFIGFSPSLTCGVWVGFDDHRTLGPKEEGSHVALPIWMDFMGEVLKDQPVEDFPHSPLLTNPEQVQEILASAAPERLLAEPSPTPVAGGNQPSAPAAGQTTLPGAPTSQTAPASAPGELQSSTSAGARSPSPPTTAQPAGSPGRTKPPSNAAPEVPKPSTATSGAKPAPPPAPSAKTGTIPPSR
jgi:penicillin-binding protein 1A